jgi:hypothetical protein
MQWHVIGIHPAECAIVGDFAGQSLIRAWAM